MSKTCIHAGKGVYVATMNPLWIHHSNLNCPEKSLIGELSVLVNGVAPICSTLSCMICNFTWQSHGLIRQATMSLYYPINYDEKKLVVKGAEIPG